jgi:hypothetical protein
MELVATFEDSVTDCLDTTVVEGVAVVATATVVAGPAVVGVAVTADLDVETAAFAVLTA